MCLDALGRTIQQRKVSYVVEADIRRHFDTVNHEWMIRFLRHRIGDERVIRLVIRMLKSGMLEDGLVRASEEGTPQGSVLSPLLSNIYLHYVLDLWFSRKVVRQSSGEAYYFRFADDFLACFQYKDDAEVFRKQGCKPKDFNFLGFTHYCGKTKAGIFKVKRRTSRKKLGRGLREFTDWAKKARRVQKKGEMLRGARIRVMGHLSYYAITDNLERCSYYVYRATRILFKWLNRKSQRKAYTWKRFNQALAWVNWPRLKVRKNLNPFRRVEIH